MNTQTKRNTMDMTSGNPMKLIVMFSIPVLLGAFLQQLYNLTDTVIVGQKLGTDALAAMGATSSLISLVFCLSQGLTNGFSIVLAQYFGAKNKEKMRETLALTVVMSLFFTIVITILSLYLAKPILLLLQTPEAIIEDSMSYLRIIFMGMILTMIYNACQNVMRAIGNSVAPLVFLAVSVLLNIGMDIYFIFGLNQGIKGAAVATVVAQAISAVVSLLYIVLKCPELHIDASDFFCMEESGTKPGRKRLKIIVFRDWNLIMKMLTTGFSMAMMWSIVAIGSVILQSGINGLGKDTIAAHTTARKIMEVVMNPFSAIGTGAATFAGQNYGAGRMDRVKTGGRDALILTFIWSTISVLVICPFAPFFASLIAKKEKPYIIDTASMYLRISIPAFYALGVLVVLRNMLQGIGRRIVPLLASLIEMFGKVLVIWILVPRIQYLGICLAEPMIWVVDALLVLITFLCVKTDKNATIPTTNDNPIQDRSVNEQ